MIYVTYGIRGNAHLVHAKTEVCRVAFDVFHKRGQPYPMVAVQAFMAQLENDGGLENVAGFFFEQDGDFVMLEKDGEVKSFYAINGCIETGGLN